MPFHVEGVAVECLDPSMAVIVAKHVIASERSADIRMIVVFTGAYGETSVEVFNFEPLIDRQHAAVGCLHAPIDVDLADPPGSIFDLLELNRVPANEAFRL